MKPFGSRIAGDNDIWVVAEPLQVAIPDISMNIIIGGRRQPKKFNVPNRSQDEQSDDNSPGKLWRSEKLTDRQEVGDARKRQRGHEIWSTSIAEIARANE
jgi:hypothetical protein